MTILEVLSILRIAEKGLGKSFILPRIYSGSMSSPALAIVLLQLLARLELFHIMSAS